MTDPTLEPLELSFGSEFPTEVGPERAALAARLAAERKAREGALVNARPDEERWCDSEAPTAVAAERPLLPRPPRAPSV